MDFSVWTFDEQSEKLIRRIQERAAKVVWDELMKKGGVDVKLISSDKKPKKPVVGVFLLEEWDNCREFALSDVFDAKRLSEGYHSDDELRFLIKFFEDYVAACKKALG